MKQVNKKHYSFESYCYPERFASYYHQLREIFATEPDNVLEVGVGDKVIANYIKDNSSIVYTSVDIAEDLKPDVVGSVLNLPFKDKSFDTVCAFEVLEHIPFENLEKAIKEMSRVARKKVLISVPHFGPPIKFYLKIPKIEIKFLFKLPVPKKHVFNGQHYWEIGKSGYGLSKVKSAINKHAHIINEYVPFDTSYHHFFVIEP